MKLYSENKDYKLYQGNMLDMLEVIEPNSIDSIITDPPYELNFMNKGWDASGIAFQKETWRKCYEVLKSGGYLLTFGGSRTFHRIACAIEDAGFEIRDTIMWLYGSGFPKSMSLDKALEGKLTTGSGNKTQFKKLNGKLVDRGDYGYAKMMYNQDGRPNDYNLIADKRLDKLDPTTEIAKKYAGWGTALKPSFEPIIVARKPFKGSLVDNVIAYGVGGINIDECRVGNETTKTIRNGNSGINGVYGKDNRKFEKENPTGRFPANTILTYDETDYDEVCGGFPNTKNSGGKIKNKDFKCYGGSMMNNTNLAETLTRGQTIYNAPCDSGSASRYFYCAKASKKDRDEGLDKFEEKPKTLTKNKGRTFNDRCAICGKKFIGPPQTICHCENPITDKPKSAMSKNTHPTVKPTELMQYLIRLVSPNGATILDCFNGSGSTGKAVMYENRERNKNYKYIGIELTEEYLPIAKARIEYVCNLEPEKDMQMSIFDFIGDENE